MSNTQIRIFLGGDVFGPVGLRCAETILPSFLCDASIDFCVLNGENATGGTGISGPDALRLLAAGADVITGGNHSFEKRDYWPALAEMPQLLRPANFPPPIEEYDNAPPGRGSGVFEKNGIRYAVLNVQGREEMTPLDCPFRAADTAVSTWNAEEKPPVILIDFHAESTREKEALALYLAGRVAAVAGTHTHVQTADERILDGGTAFVTDLGMTGPIRSVIGVDPESAIKRNITQVLYRMELPETPGALRGLVVTVDPESRRAISVERIEIPEKA